MCYVINVYVFHFFLPSAYFIYNQNLKKKTDFSLINVNYCWSSTYTLITDIIFYVCIAKKFSSSIFLLALLRFFLNFFFCITQSQA